MRAVRDDLARTALFQRRRRRTQRAGRVDDVVDQHAGLAVDLADDVHHRRLRSVRGRRLSMIARSASSSRLAMRARAHHAAHVRADTRSGHPCCDARQMSASSTGEAYTLSTGMSKKPWIWSACRSTVSTRSTPAAPIMLRRQLGGDRHARRARAAILSGIAEIRNHCGDAGRRGALERIGQRQQLIKVDRARRARWLHDEHFLATDVLLDLDLHLAIAERADQRLAQRHPQPMRHVFGQHGCALPVNNIIEVDVSTVATSKPKPS